MLGGGLLARTPTLYNLVEGARERRIARRAARSTADAGEAEPTTGEQEPTTGEHPLSRRELRERH